MKSIRTPIWLADGIVKAIYQRKLMHKQKRLTEYKNVRNTTNAMVKGSKVQFSTVQ